MIILYQNGKRGREPYSGEKETERVREYERRWTRHRASVGNPVVYKTCVLHKGSNASGDRLRFIRNVRMMDNDVSHGFDLQMFLTANDQFE